MTGKDITAYILAGGSSRRMGVDKLFLRIGGLPLLEHTISVCEKHFRQVKLVSGKADKFASLDYPVVIDSPRASGPMAGIIAALEDCQNDYCFVTAADLYDLSEEILASITSRYDERHYMGILERGGVQPLCGIYHKSALKILDRFAKKENYRMTEAVRAMHHLGVMLPDGEWRNINRPEDLAFGGYGG